MNIETSWPRMEVKLRDMGVTLLKNAACFMCSAVRDTQVTFASLTFVQRIFPHFYASCTNTFHVPCATTFDAPWNTFQ